MCVCMHASSHAFNPHGSFNLPVFFWLELLYFVMSLDAEAQGGCLAGPVWYHAVVQACILRLKWTLRQIDKKNSIHMFNNNTYKHPQSYYRKTPTTCKTPVPEYILYPALNTSITWTGGISGRYKPWVWDKLPYCVNWWHKKALENLKQFTKVLCTNVHLHLYLPKFFHQISTLQSFPRLLHYMVLWVPQVLVPNLE